MPRSLSLSWIAALMLAGASAPALAQSVSQADLSEMRAAVSELRAEQVRAQKRIAELETALAAQQTQTAVQAQAPQSAASAPVSSASVTSAPASPSVVSTPSKLVLSGDARVRYEANFGNDDARNRHRGVLRARLRASYAVKDWLTVGGQLATGDPDDPNSTDITLSNFDDDLMVSLDQIYLRLRSGSFESYLGKMPQPFVRTELVWDGDVSPQGASLGYATTLGNSGVKAKATGLYFLVDESVAGPDSRMIGGQIGIETAANRPLRAELAIGYYDYNLRSLTGADAGDFRSNRVVNGAYLSDFNLLNVTAAVTWNGLGEAWPLRVVGDYVHNYGAIDDRNHGFGVDVLLGRVTRQGDLRLTYGYAQADVDAVLAAFSHDNTDIATNYNQHTLAVDFVPATNVLLTATYYHYKPKDSLYAGTNDANDWLNRFRMNFLVNF